MVAVKGSRRRVLAQAEKNARISLYAVIISGLLAGGASIYNTHTTNNVTKEVSVTTCMEEKSKAEELFSRHPTVPLKISDNSVEENACDINGYLDGLLEEHATRLRGEGDFGAPAPSAS